MIDKTLKVPLSVITTVFTHYAKRANTAPERKYLFEIVEALGTNISTENSGLTLEEFVTACGVSREWGKVAA